QTAVKAAVNVAVNVRGQRRGQTLGLAACLIFKRLTGGRRRLRVGEHLCPTVRRLQRYAPKRAAAIVLQQNVGSLGDVEQTAFQLQPSLLCHTFQNGVAVHARDLVRRETIAGSQQL